MSNLLHFAVIYRIKERKIKKPQNNVKQICLIKIKVLSLNIELITAANHGTKRKQKMKNLTEIGFIPNSFKNGFYIKNESQLNLLIGETIEVFYTDFDNGNILSKGVLSRVEKISEIDFVAYDINNVILFTCQYFEASNGRYDINGNWVSDNSFKEGMYAGDDMDLISVRV